VENSILELWNEVRAAIETADLDVRKNAAGNASAGVRARKGLRALRGKLATLVKLTVETEKGRKKEKEAAE
jgi:hypothetical protein